MVFGFAHGLGWICMVLLILAALRARVVPMRTAFAVTVLGGIAPFFGSWEFVREGRRRDGLGWARRCSRKRTPAGTLG